VGTMGRVQFAGGQSYSFVLGRFGKSPKFARFALLVADIDSGNIFLARFVRLRVLSAAWSVGGLVYSGIFYERKNRPLVFGDNRDFGYAQIADNFYPRALVATVYDLVLCRLGVCYRLSAHCSQFFPRFAYRSSFAIYARNPFQARTRRSAFVVGFVVEG
jgi:hypothetical protein